MAGCRDIFSGSPILMEVGSLGEFKLIKLIRDLLGRPPGNVLVGIDDDAAVVELPDGRCYLLTSDMFLEGIHFKTAWATPWQIGWRAMAANLSDVAAMGGEPLFALVSVSIPPSTEVGFVGELYKGIGAISSEFGCSVVGGDTNSSGSGLVISIALFGRADRARISLRSGAEIGDLIFVTGDLGGSKAGLEVLKRGREPFRGMDETLIGRILAKHLEPIPRIREARAISAKLRVSSAIDISDGLSSDLHHICERSGVGARLYADRIPVDEGTEEVARRLSKSPMDYVLSGGEDFELLFTVPRGEPTERISEIEGLTGTKISLIGEIVSPSDGCKLIYPDGAEVPVEPSGYRHF